MADTKARNTIETVLAARTHRRQLLKGAAAGAALAATGVRAPAVLAQAKPFAGTTLNSSYSSSPENRDSRSG